MRTHPVSVWILVVVGSVLIAVGALAAWARTAALDTGVWTDESTQVLESPAVRTALSGYIVDQIFATRDVPGLLSDSLPPRLKPLAAPIAGGLRQGAYRVVDQALTRPRVQEVWRVANRQAHADLVRAIEGKTTVLQVHGGVVALDVGSLVGDVALRLGLPPSLAQKVEAQAKPIVIVRASQLSLVRRLYNALQAASLVLGLLGLAFWALAVYLAHGRRRIIVRRVSASLAIVGLTLLALRAVVGNTVIGSLVKADSLRPAAQDVWSIFTGTLADVAWIAIGLGVAGLIWAWATGPARYAVAARWRVGPHVAERALVVHTSFAVVVLALIAWGPLQQVLRLVAIAIILALAFWGLELFRRQAAADGAVTHGPAGPEALARLDALRARGALTDDEHAVARSHVDAR